MKNNIWSLKFLFGFDTISTSFLRVRCAWILLLAEENVDVYTSVHTVDNISDGSLVSLFGVIIIIILCIKSSSYSSQIGIGTK